MNTFSLKVFIYTIINLYLHFTFATIYTLPDDPQNRLIGKNIEYLVPLNNTDSLDYVAEKFQVSLRNILEVNPKVDLYLPNSNTLLTIPKQLILPNTSRTGIIVNSVETRLFYYPINKNIVFVFPISIGTKDHTTPLHWVTTVGYKKKYPIWIPTQDMRNEYFKHGEILPTQFLPGPNNPMGDYALYIGENFAIHGAKKNFKGIGLRVTRGCIRLRAKDIACLYTLVPIGTRVKFIDEPIKITTDQNGIQYIEIHCPLFKSNKNQQNPQLIRTELKKNVYKILQDKLNINYKIVDQAIEECSGIPVNITK